MIPPPVYVRFSSDIVSSLLSSPFSSTFLANAACGCCCSLVPFYSEKETFMADLRSKYVYRSYIALLETTFFWIFFSVFWWRGGPSSAGYDRKVPEYTEFLHKIQPRGRLYHRLVKVTGFSGSAPYHPKIFDIRTHHLRTFLKFTTTADQLSSEDVILLPR